jgi:hypothetical protein
MYLHCYIKKKAKKLREKKTFVGILKAPAKKSRIRIRMRNLEYGSKDPDPYENVRDPDTLP